MLHTLAQGSKRSASDLNQLQALYDRGEFRKSLFQARKVIKARPDHVGLHALAGFSALRLGEGSVADELLGQAVELALSQEAPAVDLAQALKQAGRFRQALPLFVACLKKEATNASALNGLGVCLLETGAIDNAITILGEALNHAPHNAEFAADLGRAFERSGQEQTALKCHEIACKLAPADQGKLLAYARLLYQSGEFETGIAVLAVAVGKWSRDAAVLNAYASFLNTLGLRDEAVAYWQAAIAADPGHGTAYLNFALRHTTASIPNFEQHLDQALKRNPTPENESKLRFAKVRVHEERGELDAAYDNLCRANALHFPETGFDLASEHHLFANLKRQFSLWPPSLPAPSPQEVSPIFILGLPRSGSTLVETILGRHTDVMQRGELDYLAPQVRQMDLLRGSLTPDQIKGLQRAYLMRLTQSGQNRFVTDKMPLNFRLIGHIATAMPDARILHVYRDPKATCWSSFSHRFSGDGLGFTCDVESLLAYFNLYQDLMAFWHARFPGRIIDVDYEALVADPNAEIPALIAALGLDWEEACLSPEESSEISRTASEDQVRRKIYKGSVKGWQRYAKQAGGWLGRLPEHGAQAWVQRRFAS